MMVNLAELYKRKAELLRLPESKNIKQLEDIYHKRTRGVYIGDAVFGANDGIITTFAVVAGASGALLGPAVVIILGAANLIADGISMGIGSYLGRKSELDYARAQRKKEMWEVEHFPEIERHEIGEIFREWGFGGQDLERAVAIVSNNKKAWIDFMMMNELGLAPEGKTNPFKHGSVTFASFLIAGLIPLIPFFLPVFPKEQLFPVSILFTGIALFLVGAFRSLVSPVSWPKGGLEILLIGSVAAAAAYIVGAFLRNIVNGIL